MTNYNSTFSIALPAALAEIAAKIGRAMDADVGGANSFTLSDDGETISTSTPCTQEFAAQAEWMLTHPEALHAACAADYAARWADLVPPTLAECEQFCNSVILPQPDVATGD